MIKALTKSLAGLRLGEVMAFVRSQLHPAFLPGEYINDKDQLSSALGYLMCQHLLWEQGFDKEQLSALRKGEYGKWQLPHSSVDFNISHSGDMVVAALTDQGLAGVDIEVVKPIEWQEYKGCFTSEEWIRLTQSPDQQLTFFELWTCKESFSKAYGLGLQLSLDQIIVENDIGYTIEDPARKGFFSPLAIPGYCACICSTLKQKIDIQPFNILPGS